MTANITTQQSLIIEVNSPEVIEDVMSNYECFCRADIDTECVLDLSFINEGENHKELCNILEIQPDSDAAKKLNSGGYAVIFC